MPSYDAGGGDTTPFGRNEFLRSTKIFQTESYTCGKESVPSRTIDGNSGQKILQPGTVMAKITSGPNTGKIGPFQAGATDGRQTPANIVGLDITFLPWTLIERDVEVAVMYGGVVIQQWCVELNSAGDAIALTDATRDAITALPYFTTLVFSK